MRGRPPKPTALKLINGSAKKHPGRVNRDEPKGKPITPGKIRMPRNMSALEQTKYLEIVHGLPDGVLAQSDLDLVQLTARLSVRMESDLENFTASHIGQLRSCWQQLGMTPSARSTIRVPKVEPPKKGKFDGLGSRPATQKHAITKDQNDRSEKKQPEKQPEEQ